MMPEVSSLRPDSRPLYVQAVDALYDLIERGPYAPGQMLPPEAALARRLGVSRSTVREAMGHLEKDGLITRRHGVGTFIAAQSAELVGGLERLTSFRSVAEMAGARVDIAEREVQVIDAPPDVAAALQVDAGSRLARVQLALALDGRRIAYMDGYVAEARVAASRLTEGDGSLLEFLISQPDVQVSYARSQVVAIDADRELAEKLSVAEGRSLLRLEETVYSDMDKPIAFFRNYFVTERYSFRIVRRIVRRGIPFGRQQERSAS